MGETRADINMPASRHIAEKTCTEITDPKAMNEMGTACLENGSFSEAWQWFMRAAKKGSAAAYHELGRMLEQGKVSAEGSRDEKILKYYGISAVMGYAEGQKELGDCYFSGKYGLVKDTSLAEKWYGYAATQDHCGASFMLGSLTGDIRWFKKAAALGSVEALYRAALLCGNTAEKKALLTSACDKGHEPAIIALANLYKNEGNPDSLKEAYRLYDLAFSSYGSSNGAMELARMFASGIPGNVRDISRSLELIRFAEKKGHPEALYCLGYMYMGGNAVFGIPADSSKSAEYFKHAADLGHVSASYYYGMICVSMKATADARKYLTAAALKGHVQAKCEAAKACWEMKDYGEAIRWYTEATGIPNAEAQKTLGHIYMSGTKVAKDYAAAVRFYSMSPACEDPEVQLKIAQMYHDGGFGLNADLKESFSWIRKAAGNDNTEAQFRLGYALCLGAGLLMDKKEAMAWLSKAAGKDHVAAMVMTGTMLAKGEGTADGAPDYPSAMQMFTRAAELGSYQAKANMGILYFRGQGTERQPQLAFSLLTEAAAAGILCAMKMVAMMYMNGEGTDANPALAFSWYRKAADNGDADSMFTVAEMYRYGEGTAQDACSALEYYKKCADQDNLTACGIAGYMFLYGEGCETDLKLAKRYLAKAAAGGIPEAKYHLGEAFFATRAYDKSIRLFTEAADAGCVDAMYRLGEEYSHGKIIPQDILTAETYLRKAAEAGMVRAKSLLACILWTSDPSADYCEAVSLFNDVIASDPEGTEYDRSVIHFYLAEAYRVGSGTGLDLQKALEHYKMSATFGNADAMVWLSRFFSNGWAVQKDRKMSHRWMENAAMFGSEYAKKVRDSLGYRLFGWVW